MRYIDSGGRDPLHALGTWLEGEAKAAPTELRLQSGFFGADGLLAMLPAFHQLRQTNGLTRVVIGSNKCATLVSDVEILADQLDLGRSNARLGLVSFSSGFFHPKSYHFRRPDGSQAAYVGSANLSFSGVTAQHIEAGVILDTVAGDPPHILDEIAKAVDDWWVGGRLGFYSVSGKADILALENLGIIRQPPPPTSGGNSAGNGSGPKLPSLKPLIKLPIAPWTAKSKLNSPPPAPSPTTPTSANNLISVPISPPYPQYVLFKPNATQATSGVTALTGTGLPGAAAGLIVRLNKDSARHWLGGVGTANLSIPVPSISTLRFGIFKGKFDRPRAEFELEMRYWSTSGSLKSSPTTTSIMVYGFAPGETGHGDVRMVIPKPPARQIADLVAAAGLPMPQVGDVALLEWPDLSRPTFRLTMIQRNHSLHANADQQLVAAIASGQQVGHGACWLPSGLSPVW